MQHIAGPDLCHCLAVRRSARYLSRIYDQHLAAVGVSSSQFSLLALLAQYPLVSISDLATKMVMERTTLVRALKPLQSQGLISSQAEGARGALRLSLSHAGRTKLEEAEPYWQNAQRELEEQVGQNRMVDIRTSLLSVALEQ